jgi:hypothetical protein
LHTQNLAEQAVPGVGEVTVSVLVFHHFCWAKLMRCWTGVREDVFAKLRAARSVRMPLRIELTLFQSCREGEIRRIDQLKDFAAVDVYDDEP